MSKRNEIIILFIILFIAGILLAVSLSLMPNLTPTSENQTLNSEVVKEIVKNTPIKKDSKTDSNVAVKQQISFGEKILIKEKKSSQKQKGVRAMAAGNFEEAANHFQKALDRYKNEPETRIYLNNARIGQERHYTIALSVPISSDPNGALEMMRGVAQAQYKINNSQEKINGIPLKVLLADDRENPEIAQKIAIEFTKNKDILGVVGHYASDTTLAAGEIYDKEKLVAISPVSTSVKLSDFSDYVFRTVPSDSIAAKALADYMLDEMGQKKVAVFFNAKSGYSRSLKSEFSISVFAKGGDIVAEFNFSKSGFDAYKKVNEANEKGAQVLMLAASVSTIDEALQVVSVNRKKLPLLGGDDVYTPKTLTIHPQFSEGMIIAIPWHIDRVMEPDFSSLSKKLWRTSRVSWRTILAYDATKSLIAAIEINPTRDGIKEELSNPDFSITGASGKIEFFPWGDRKSKVQLVRLVKSNNFSSGYDFVPID
ncbi:MAG: ABC transporter substrate-binding protein [Prochloraceae cyanobacterium]|nr:ABC transporter substrate-binding protein [Prochloraceae cyanobacterium]